MDYTQYRPSNMANTSLVADYFANQQRYPGGMPQQDMVSNVMQQYLVDNGIGTGLQNSVLGGAGQVPGAEQPWYSNMPSMENIGTAVGAAGGLAGIYFGNQQLGIAKDRLDMDKERYAYLVGRDKQLDDKKSNFASNFAKAYENRTV